MRNLLIPKEEQLYILQPANLMSTQVGDVIEMEL